MGLAALAGTALLVVAEFTTLYTEHISTRLNPIGSTGTGSHHSYALIPIAALVLLLAYAVVQAGSRPALLAIGIAGVVALLIALVGDLPDANSTGNLPTTPSGPLAAASNSAGPGMYLETAAAVLLIATCGLGFLLLGPPKPVRGRPLGGSPRSPGDDPARSPGEDPARSAGEGSTQGPGEDPAAPAEPGSRNPRRDPDTPSS